MARRLTESKLYFAENIVRVILWLLYIIRFKCIVAQDVKCTILSKLQT